jgi:anti-sigma factor RsiW
MTLSDETLMAYVDGELDEHARGEVEAAMLSNPDIAARVARHQALRKRVHFAFERVVDERVPDRLVAAVRGAPAPTRENNVIPLRRKQSRQHWSWPEWTSIAASLGAGAVLSFLFMHYSDVQPITSRNGRLFANGALAQALSDQLAGTQSATAAGSPRTPVQIGVSFRDKSGDYCRTFALSDASALAGLACHSGGGWRVEVLARGEHGADAAAQYRPAASSMPKPILESVEDRIAGEPLDARGEAAAKDRGWTVQ